MTRIIALSGPGNTGKSTAITRIKEHYEQQGKTVRLFGETARELINVIGGKIENPLQFQTDIERKEACRIQVLKQLKQQELYDVIIVDRAYMDNILYAQYRGLDIQPTTSEDVGLYDTVYLLDKPYKTSTLLPWQSDPKFIESFGAIHQRYGDIVYNFDNGQALLDYIKQCTNNE